MKVQFYEDIEKYNEVVVPFLIKKEAENNLIFSVLNAIRNNPTRYGDEKPFLLTVKHNDEIKLVSLRTPPYNQLISYTENLKSIDTLIDIMLRKNMQLPGITGFKDGVKRFIQLWCEDKNLKPQLIRNERVYKLEKVSKGFLGNREFFVGTEGNQSLILSWAREFILEALNETEESFITRSLEGVKNDIKAKKIFLLKDGQEIVSMARKAGKTPNGNLVNLVYTPPNLRRKGYATESVAKLSKLILEEGNLFCFLFTDLMNPVSNTIYQKIGYNPVIDVDEFKFIT
ncbi:MAG: GNAT family N-acetyltransferase [Promethearchaeota archaeon]